MGIDLEAIRRHVVADDDGDGNRDCWVCRGNTYELAAEVFRLRVRLWKLISPSSNLHDSSCAPDCWVVEHFPQGEPE